VAISQWLNAICCSGSCCDRTQREPARSQRLTTAPGCSVRHKCDTGSGLCSLHANAMDL